MPLWKYRSTATARACERERRAAVSVPAQYGPASGRYVVVVGRNLFRDPLYTSTAYVQGGTYAPTTVSGEAFGVATAVRFTRTGTSGARASLVIPGGLKPSTQHTLLFSARTSGAGTLGVFHRPQTGTSTTGQTTLANLSSTTQPQVYAAVFTTSSTGNGSLPNIALTSGSGAVGNWIEVTLGTIVEGSHLEWGQWHGSTADTPSLRFDWTGPENDSVSTRSTIT